MYVKLDHPMDFMLKWPFVLKKECLNPGPMMFLLGLFCGLKSFSKGTDSPSRRGSLCWHRALLNHAYKSVFVSYSYLDASSSSLKKTHLQAICSLKEPSKMREQNYLPGFTKLLLALKER